MEANNSRSPYEPNMNIRSSPWLELDKEIQERNARGFLEGNQENKLETISRDDDTDGDRQEDPKQIAGNEGDEGPKDYVTDVYEIKNTNQMVEDAIDYFNKYYANRRCLKPKNSKRPIATTSSLPSKPTLKLSSNVPTVPSSTNGGSSSRKKIQFGTNRVVIFKDDEIVPKYTRDSKLPNPAQSALKKKDDKKQTPNNDYELVGDNKLLNAIARCFTLCDVPLTEFDRNDAVYSLNRLGRGISTSFKSKELCLDFMRKQDLKAAKKEAKESDDEILRLESEKECLAKENAELNEKMREISARMDIVALESEKSMEVVDEKRKELLKMNSSMEEMRLDLSEAKSKLQVLSVESQTLRKENEGLRVKLEEQKGASKPLFSQIRNLEKSLLKEQISVREAQKRMVSLEKFRSDSSRLQTKLQLIERSNATLHWENKNLSSLNTDLSCKIEILQGQMKDFDARLTTSWQKNKEMEAINRKLNRERDHYQEENEKLLDLNLTLKSEFGVQTKELKYLHKKAFKECRIRDKQLHSVKCEVQKMGEALRETRERLEGRKEQSRIYSYKENAFPDGGRSANIRSTAPSRVGGGHRILRSLTNRINLSPSMDKLGIP